MLLRLVCHQSRLCRKERVCQKRAGELYNLGAGGETSGMPPADAGQF